jgi:hypothetical protein
MMKKWQPREMMDENPTGWRLVAIITLSLSSRGGSDYGLWDVCVTYYQDYSLCYTPLRQQQGEERER